MRSSFGLGVVLGTMSLSLVSCRQNPPVTVVADTPFTLAVGAVAHVADSDLDLRFRRVVADSRCPRNAQCVWAGEARAQIEARIMKGEIETFEVVIGGGGASADSAKWTVYDGYRIRLDRLDPYPDAAAPVDSSRYVATLVVHQR